MFKMGLFWLIVSAAQAAQALPISFMVFTVISVWVLSMAIY